MNAVYDGLDQEPVQSQAVIITGSLIGVKTVPISAKHNNVLGNSIYKLLKLALRQRAILGIDHLTAQRPRCHNRASFSKCYSSERPNDSEYPNAASGEGGSGITA